MPRKSKYNWPELFAQFEACGVTQREFCAAQKIAVSYFSQRYSKHRQSTVAAVSGSASGFIELTNRPASNQDGVILSVGRAKLHLPADIDPAYVAQLLQLVS